MTSLNKTGTRGSFTLGMGLLLTACTIEVPVPDDDGYGGASSSGSDAAADTAGNTGGAGGSAGTTSNAGTGAAATGGSAGSASAAGGSSGSGGSSGGRTSSAGTGEAGDGGTGDTANDNCPDDPSSDQTDTDSDGLGDVCDADDDQDGFVDQDDPDPLDTDVPGDFSTPEKVLADPRMVAAIEALREAGFEFKTHLKTDPPDLTGYFRKAEGEGEFVANSGGGGIGVAIVGSEGRMQLSESGTLENSRVSFADGEPTAFAIVTGQTVRGTGDEFTIYRTSRGVCTEAGSSHVRFAVAIESGTVDATGNLIDTLTLGLTVATQGELTSECASRSNGLTENENEWTASLVPLHKKIEVSQLKFMCVDADFGYAPTETWSRADEVCECTIEYEVSCAAP